MHDGAVKSVGTSCREASEFPMAIGLRQVRCSYSRGGVLVYVVYWWYSVGRWIERYHEFEIWEMQEALESKDFEISRKKTKYMN